MIIGIGVDVVEIDRIQKIAIKNDTFALKLLTPTEYARYQTLQNRRKIEFLAGRFAAKEAFSKAMGTGIGKLSFQHIEITNNGLGAPVLTCDQFDGIIHLSISHSHTVAVAQVVLERGA